MSQDLYAGRRIIDSEGVQITIADVDLTRHKLVPDSIIKEIHPAIEAAEAQTHRVPYLVYLSDGSTVEVSDDDSRVADFDGHDFIFTLPDGDDRQVIGKELKEIVDVEAVDAVDAWDEHEEVWRRLDLTEDERAYVIVEVEKKAREAAVSALASILAASVDDEAALNVSILFDEWRPDSFAYSAGDRVRYGGALFKCLQPHTSQTAWDPASAASLWAKVLSTDVSQVVDWVQPSSTNGYQKGQIVSHDGAKYRSLVDQNVWEPGVTGTACVWVQVG